MAGAGGRKPGAVTGDRWPDSAAGRPDSVAGRPEPVAGGRIRWPVGRNRLRIRIRIQRAAVLARILGRGGRTPPFEAAERNNMEDATTCPKPRAGIQGFDAYRVAV